MRHHVAMMLLLVPCASCEWLATFSSGGASDGVHVRRDGPPLDQPTPFDVPSLDALSQDVASPDSARDGSSDTVGDTVVDGPLGGFTRCGGDGNAWCQPASPPTTQALYAVWGTDPRDVYAVGAGGIIIHFDGTAWSTTSIVGTRLEGVWGDAGVVIAVGQGGTIVERTGGSVTWSKVASGTSSWLRDVWGSAATGFWAVGSSSTLLYRGNGSWASEAAPLGQAELTAVFGSGNVVFAAGSHPTYGGVYLARDVNGWGYKLRLNYHQSVWATAGELFLGSSYATNSGAVHHLASAGWVSPPTLGAQAIHGVFGRTARDVFVVGAGGEVHRYDGAGGALSAVNTGVTVTLRDVWASGSHVFVVGDAGTVLHYVGP